MRNALALAAAIIASTGAIPYIIDITRGKTHPNLVTWVTYTLINIVGGFAALNAGEPRTAFLNLFGALATGSIAAMGIKHGVRTYSKFDVACQILAVIGLIVWQLTGVPAIAVAIALFVMLIASLPTWRHAWIAPYAETWQGYLIGAAGSALTVATLSGFNFVALGFPIAIILNNSTIVGIVLIRRRRPAMQRAR